MKLQVTEMTAQIMYYFLTDSCKSVLASNSHILKYSFIISRITQLFIWGIWQVQFLYWTTIRGGPESWPSFLVWPDLALQYDLTGNASVPPLVAIIDLIGYSIV